MTRSKESACSDDRSGRGRSSRPRGGKDPAMGRGLIGQGGPHHGRTQSSTRCIQRQLAGLTATQKMLTAALVAIMAITVVWWGKYAGESEMVPLTSQSFSAAEWDRISDQLPKELPLHRLRRQDPCPRRAAGADPVLPDLFQGDASRHAPGDGGDPRARNVFDSETTNERIWNTERRHCCRK